MGELIITYLCIVAYLLSSNLANWFIIFCTKYGEEVAIWSNSFYEIRTVLFWPFYLLKALFYKGN